MRERFSAAMSLHRRLRRLSVCLLVYAAIIGIGLEVVAQTMPATAVPPASDNAMLRVEAQGSEPAVFNVFVDGRRVGTTPWEGTVEPGEHIVQIANDKSGSMLARADAFEGSFEVLRLTTRPLGPPVRVQVKPKTAELKLESIFLGPGQWEGRLPLGFYTLSASERGYRRFELTLRILPGDEPLFVQFTLERDPGHPRWPQPKRGLSWLGPTVGVGWTPTLRSDAEADCPAACTGDEGALGLFGGLRAVHVWRSRLSAELEAGYLQLDTAFRRVTMDLSSPIPKVASSLKDELRLAGPFVSLGAGYRFPLSDWFALSAGLQIGAVIATSSDSVSGVIDGNTREIVATKPVRSVAVFVMPEVAALVRLGPFELGPVLRVGGFPLEGPHFEHATQCRSGVATPCTPDPLREQAYGPFVLIAPQVRLGYVFD